MYSNATVQTGVKFTSVQFMCYEQALKPTRFVHRRFHSFVAAGAVCGRYNNKSKCRRVSVFDRAWIDRRLRFKITAQRLNSPHSVLGKCVPRPANWWCAHVSNSVSIYSLKTIANFKKAVVDIILRLRSGATPWCASLSIHRGVKSVLPLLSH